MTKTHRPLLPYFVVPAIPLLLPLMAMKFTVEGVHWTRSDFVIAYLLLAGAGLTYRLVIAGTMSAAYRGGAALAVFAGLTLIWVNLAVGFIGREDNPANLLFGGVLALGIIGTCIARLKAAGMTRALAATAAAQFLVPIIAFLVWRPNFDAGVIKIFALNAIWGLMFAGSALLFHRAARGTNL